MEPERPARATILALHQWQRRVTPARQRKKAAVATAAETTKACSINPEEMRVELERSGESVGGDQVKETSVASRLQIEELTSQVASLRNEVKRIKVESVRNTPSRSLRQAPHRPTRWRGKPR